MKSRSPLNNISHTLSVTSLTDRPIHQKASPDSKSPQCKSSYLVSLRINLLTTGIHRGLVSLAPLTVFVSVFCTRYWVLNIGKMNSCESWIEDPSNCKGLPGRYAGMQSKDYPNGSRNTKGSYWILNPMCWIVPFIFHWDPLFTTPHQTKQQKSLNLMNL